MDPHIISQIEACLQDDSKLAQGQELVSRVKLALLTAEESSIDTTVAVTALELGALLAIKAQDLDNFSKSVAQLQPYYYCTTQKQQQTPRKLLVTGLHLMHLLVENRWSEFHSILELLNEQEATSPYISFPVGLERQLMVGIYDEILTAQPPDAAFAIFLDLTVQTVRDAIADCMEVSYKTLTVSQAAAMMKLNSTQELLDYVQESREDWIVQNQTVLLFEPVVATQAQDEIPSKEWIQQSLTYATEMERIV